MKLDGVFSEHVPRPMLIDGRKVDMRAYVLIVPDGQVACCDWTFAALLMCSVMQVYLYENAGLRVGQKKWTLHDADPDAQVGALGLGSISSR